MTPSSESGIIIALAITSFVNMGLQGLQMYLDSRKEGQQIQISNLTNELQRALTKIDFQDEKIVKLQQDVYEITQSDSYHRGRLDAMESNNKDRLDVLESVSHQQQEILDKKKV